MSKHNDKPWYKRIFRWGGKQVYIVGAVVVLFALALCSESNAAALSTGVGQSKYKADVQVTTICTNNFRWCGEVTRFGTEKRGWNGYKHIPAVVTVGAYRRAQFRSTKSVRPYVSLGISYADKTTVTQASKANFRLGVGVLYVRDSWFLDLGALHYSNASLKRPNSGRDGYVLQLGKVF